jgi:hypothetical protein
MHDNLHKISFIASDSSATALAEVQLTFRCVQLSENKVVDLWRLQSQDSICASGEQSIAQKIIPMQLPSKMTEYIKISH